MASANLTANPHADIWLGTTAGGVVLLRNKSVVNVWQKAAADLNIRIFPNPGSKCIYIQAAHSCQIVVTSVTGKEMFNKQVSSANRYEINADGWPQGVYFIHTQNAQGLSNVVKWIKE